MAHTQAPIAARSTDGTVICMLQPSGFTSAPGRFLTPRYAIPGRSIASKGHPKVACEVCSYASTASNVGLYMIVVTY